MNKTIFSSNKSYNDAKLKARASGFIVIGQAMNRNGQYVVFARKQIQGNNNGFDINRFI